MWYPTKSMTRRITNIMANPNIIPGLRICIANVAKASLETVKYETLILNLSLRRVRKNPFIRTSVMSVYYLAKSRDKYRKGDLK